MIFLSQKGNAGSGAILCMYNVVSYICIVFLPELFESFQKEGKKKEKSKCKLQALK